MGEISWLTPANAGVQVSKRGGSVKTLVLVSPRESDVKRYGKVGCSETGSEEDEGQKKKKKKRNNG